MKRVVLLCCALLSFPALAQEVGYEPDTRSAASDAEGWHYGREGSGDALRIYATVSGRIDGGAAVELTFSHCDLSGRQARLSGLPDSLDCPAVCQVGLSIDGVADKARATMPPDSEATLSLRNARALWKALEDAQRLEITYPDTSGKDGRAVFEVHGIDLTALPGW